jgi:hypothetical protein
VTAADAALWRDTLAGRPDATVHDLPALDHLFREGTGVSTPADYHVRAGHVAPDVLRLVADWILALPASP